MFCLLVVLVKLSVLDKWLARKTPLGNPNCGKIISTKPRPKSVHDFLGLLYVSLFNNCMFVLYPFLCDIFHTPMAQYSRLCVLKVPLNNNNLMAVYATSQNYVIAL